MATLVLTDATAWVGGYDFTGDTNQIALSATAEQVDVTTFGSAGYRARMASLRSVTGSLSGFWSSGTAAGPDPQLMPDLGVADRVVTLAPAAAEGGTAYLFRAGKFSASLFGQIGEAVPYSLDLAGTDRTGLVRGQVVKAAGTVSAIGATGSAVQLGPTGAGRWLYGALHTFAAGTTLTAVLESAAAADFVGATTRATFGPITATGGTWAARVAGPITDPWYRLRVTALTGPFVIACSAGIGS